MKRCPECQATYPDEVTHCYRDGERLLFAGDPGDPLVGTLLDGRFRLEARLGEGGMGAVYRGIQEPVGRPVAVKVLRSDLASDKDAVQRFFHEARVVSKLRHPHTVTLYDFGQAESGELFIAMEFLTGQTLEERMREAPLRLDELVGILDQVCQSLAEAHALGVVHRDLKPDNVFIDRVANRNLAKVLDFGIARVTEGPRLTRTGMVFGTPAFMSPEQAQGFDLDARSDIYTLGVLLFWLLSGNLPFRAETPMQLALKHVTERPPQVREVSRYKPLPMSLVSLVSDMLEKSPERRPQTVDEVRRRLRAVGRELSEVVTGPVGSETTLRDAWSPADELLGDTQPDAEAPEVPGGWSREASATPHYRRERARQGLGLAGATRLIFAVAGLLAVIGVVFVLVRGAPARAPAAAEAEATPEPAAPAEAAGHASPHAAPEGYAEAGSAEATGDDAITEPARTAALTSTLADETDAVEEAGAEVAEARWAAQRVAEALADAATQRRAEETAAREAEAREAELRAARRSAQRRLERERADASTDGQTGADENAAPEPTEAEPTEPERGLMAPVIVH